MWELEVKYYRGAGADTTLHIEKMTCDGEWAAEKLLRAKHSDFTGIASVSFIKKIEKA